MMNSSFKLALVANVLSAMLQRTAVRRPCSGTIKLLHTCNTVHACNLWWPRSKRQQWGRSSTPNSFHIYCACDWLIRYIIRVIFWIIRKCTFYETYNTSPQDKFVTRNSHRVDAASETHTLCVWVCSTEREQRKRERHKQQRECEQRREYVQYSLSWVKFLQLSLLHQLEREIYCTKQLRILENLCGVYSWLLCVDQKFGKLGQLR